MAHHLAKGPFSTLYKCTRFSQSSFLRRVRFITSSSVSDRLQSTVAVDALPPPLIDRATRDYPNHIRSIVDEISKLNLLEVADLNELLKKSLNISDAPMMAMGAMPAMAKEEEEDAAPAGPAAPSLFAVKLMKFDDTKKVALIKEIKSLMTGMNLVQAKKFVESAPAEVRKDLSKEEAETLQKALEAVGGSVSVDEID